MPIYVDGVEITELYVDGVEMYSAYADGVQVFVWWHPEWSGNSIARYCTGGCNPQGDAGIEVSGASFRPSHYEVGGGGMVGDWTIVNDDTTMTPPGTKAAFALGVNGIGWRVSGSQINGYCYTFLDGDVNGPWATMTAGQGITNDTIAHASTGTSYGWQSSGNQIRSWASHFADPQQGTGPWITV